MSDTPTTVHNLGLAMFTVSDPDAAKAFYTEKLGFEVRTDVKFGESGDQRWIEVAPPGSTARLALNPPMGPNAPGGGTIGVETGDVKAEHERLASIGGVDIDEHVMQPAGAPTMFMVRDPDGNTVVVAERAKDD